MKLQRVNRYSAELTFQFRQNPQVLGERRKVPGHDPLPLDILRNGRRGIDHESLEVIFPTHKR